MADEDPLVLLHALGMSPRVWAAVQPWLGTHRAVVALTTLGHRGGAPAARRPVRVRDLVDHTERALDERGLMRSGVARRLALRAVAVHGERLTADQALQAAEDLVDCRVVDDILATDEEVAPLDPLPYPITLAWAGADAITPVEVNGAVARARLPQARFVMLSGVGHVPMIDDPQGVAATILLASERG